VGVGLIAEIRCDETKHILILSGQAVFGYLLVIGEKGFARSPTIGGNQRS
jgi:hypothetical protein